ncbi:hypothetical protein [Nostoc sp. NMS9]|uniref:hypothetical protein n=1 Tax=Nostoc sp. NMS9 TaxID=2815393 RepID=UPI0025E06DDA|nr:hypothetical protein [Nostoc sp. NMS9]MBN3938764.1 hypothetical protein [Nostoc sp. NMS9]
MTNRPFVETRFIASLPKDVLQSLIELVLPLDLGCCSCEHKIPSFEHEPPNFEGENWSSEPK